MSATEHERLQKVHGVDAVAANDASGVVEPPDYPKFFADAIRASRYFGIHAFWLVNAAGERQACRFRWEPDNGGVATIPDAGPLCDRLLAAGLPAGPVQSIDQALTSPHAVHRGDVIAKDWYKGVASPIRLARSKPALRHVPPKFSQHATEVLTEFGYSRGEIQDLLSTGVVCGSERKC